MKGDGRRLVHVRLALLLAVLPVPVCAADRDAGEVRTAAGIYADYCSVCHGDRGEGAVWTRNSLDPPPVNFTDPRYQAVLDRERMIRSVTWGRAETAMTAWQGRLSGSEIAAVVDYVRTNFMRASANGVVAGHVDATGAGREAASMPAMDAPFAGGEDGDPAVGMGLYVANCSACHGVRGDGRGPRAYFINPKPRNFLHTESRAMLNRPALFTAIAKGRVRTEMPAWNKVLSAQQIADIAEYVFEAFIRSGTGDTKGAAADGERARSE